MAQPASDTSAASKSRSRGGEQDAENPEGDVSDGQQPGRPSRLAAKSEGGKRKRQIEEPRHVVRVLALGDKTNLAGARRDQKTDDSEEGEDAGARDVSAQKIAQGTGRVGQFPHHPDDDELLEVAAEVKQCDGAIDGPEAGKAEPEKEGQNESLHGAGSAQMSGFEDCRDHREEYRKDSNPRDVAERRPEIERVLPGNGERGHEQQSRCQPAHG